MKFYLIHEAMHGPISEEQSVALKEKKGCFECSLCSSETTKVFHNLRGRHLHKNLFPEGHFKGLEK